MFFIRLLTLIIYGGTYILGLGIQLQWWHTRRIHWVHHSLFAGIWASILATAAMGWRRRVRAWYAPLTVLLWMAPLPRFPAGGRMHQVLATAGLLNLFAALFITSDE
jgi:hypothetical protein